MKKIRKKECVNYQLSDDSSDLDEFIPKTQFIQSENTQNDNYEE